MAKPCFWAMAFCALLQPLTTWAAEGSQSEETLALVINDRPHGSITIARDLNQLMLPMKPLASIFARELAVSGEGRILSMVLPLH
jgi:hypothetical protein